MRHPTSFWINTVGLSTGMATSLLIFLWVAHEWGGGMESNMENIRLFSLVAVFILLIACINFINLSTARTMKHAHEVGIRKAVGAERRMLVKQYLSESMVVTVISMFFALALLSMIMPAFNDFTGKDITFGFTKELVVGAVGITLFTGLLAGSYPAMFLSSYRAIQVIKGDFHSSIQQIWIRKGLVVFQFWLSIIFIAAVIVIQSQLQFIADQGPIAGEEALYQTQEKVALLAKYAAALAILISCLGLLGLASFTAERRVREIGIRKALGANTQSIVWLLTGEFTRLVIWAIVLGLPVAYVILRHWLDQFVYRIELSLMFFALSAVIAILISWITLSTQAIRTAQINPSDCLRDE
ncbi:MAG: FtsX-like permease family protein [Bacteroidota bacterium]